MNLTRISGQINLTGLWCFCSIGNCCTSPEEAVEAAKEIQKQTGSDKWAVKAQIHAGGRGKGGGVKIAKTLDEVREYADQIIGMMLVTPQTKKEGKLVNKVLGGAKYLLSGT